jgi:hypothetical protein
MRLVIVLACAAMFLGAAWVVVKLSPLFLNSRIERIGEKNLPKILVERGGIVYCRMKADDFRFLLPPGTRAVNPVVTGGFDTVNGSVEARFDSTNRVTASEYENSLSGKVQIGGQITAHAIPGGLLIKFHYFGDR